MPQKRKKVSGPIHDDFVKPQHIHAAQKMMVKHGPLVLLDNAHQTEPEMVGFIRSVANDIATGVLMESDLPRPATHRLQERIIALALDIYHAHHLAVYDLYKDLFEDTRVGEIDKKPEPPAPETDAGGYLQLLAPVMFPLPYKVIRPDQLWHHML